MAQKEMTDEDAWIAMARGECVKTVLLVHRIDNGSLQFWSHRGWEYTHRLEQGPYSIVPDPSKPEKKELSAIDELMIEFAEFVDEQVGGKYEPEADLSQSDLIKVLLDFTDKKYQRKEIKQ